MNTDLSEIENEISEVKEPSPEKEKRPRSGGGLAFLAFLFALAALAGTAWMWWQDQASQGTSEDRIFTEIARLDSSDSELSLKLEEVGDQIKSLPSADHSTQLNALESRLKSGITEVDRLEQNLSEQLALTRSLQTATESMQARLQAAEAAVAGVAAMELNAGGELDLAEVDYLLRLANERLKLFADPVAADEALKLADIHLEAMDNPMYLGVRQEIGTARRELSELVLPDYFEISSELDSLQSAVGRLSFRDEVQTPQEEPQEVVQQGWWEKLKGVFSGLVTVRRSTDQENERISLQDRDYVRQRLWLQLEIAHLSLMRRDQTAFRHSLARVGSTVSEWFDDSEDSYQAVTSRLDELQTLEIQVSVPDINQPWATLRLIREGKARPARTSEPVRPAAGQGVSGEIPTPQDSSEPTVESESSLDEPAVNEQAIDEEELPGRESGQ